MAGQHGIFLSLIYLSFLLNFYNQESTLTITNDPFHPRIRKLSDCEMLSSSLCKPLIVDRNGGRKFGEIYQNNGTELSVPITSRPSLKSCLCIILLRSGDIQLNPGHTLHKPKYPCPVCTKGVIASSKAAECEKYGQKTRVRCLSSHTAIRASTYSIKYN